MAVHRVGVVYKIRNKDGKWSSGGADPTFNNVGKTWSRIGDVKRHIREVIYHKTAMKTKWDKAKNVYRDCDLVYFIESPPDTHSMEGFIGGIEEADA